MSPIDENYKISQVRPHVGLSTECTGAQPNKKENRLTLRPISDQPTAADYASRPTPKKPVNKAR